MHLGACKAAAGLDGRLKGDSNLLKNVAEESGTGFELPAERREGAPYCTRPALSPHIEQRT